MHFAHMHPQSPPCVPCPFPYTEHVAFPVCRYAEAKSLGERVNTSRMMISEDAAMCDCVISVCTSVMERERVVCLEVNW